VSSIWLDRHASTSITGWTIARSAISAASALGGEFAGVSGLDGGIVRIGRWLVGWRCVGLSKVNRRVAGIACQGEASACRIRDTAGLGTFG